MRTAPHIAIIGAGPAGSAAALLLARAGLRVTLLESKPFPRLKVCGEYISPAVTAPLEALIPAPDLLAAGARRVATFALTLNRHSIERPAPAPAWALSRSTLDHLLLTRAGAAGAQVLQPATVARVSYHDDRVDLTLTDTRALSADLLLHADGSGRHDPAGPTPTLRGYTGHKCHLHLDALPPPERTGVRMRSAPGAYLGTIAVEQGLATLALVARNAVIKDFRGDVDAAVTHLWGGSPDSGYRREWRASPWLASPVARSPFIPSGHPRSFRLGNAAAAVDPVGGEGIGLAIWSATFLARLLIDLSQTATSATTAGAGSSRLEAVHREYARGYRRRLRGRAPACRLAAELLARPALVGAAWPVLARIPVTTALWMRWTGKPAVVDAR